MSVQALPSDTLDRFIAGIPKTVLHVHIEGTLEPELAFALAQRNGLTPGSPQFPYASLDALRTAYAFDDLAQFLDLYYALCGTLKTEQDFCDLAAAYSERLLANNVRVAEVFFDPQTHTARGIAFNTVVQGLNRGFAAARRKGVEVLLIMCWLRDAPVGTEDDLRRGDPEKGFASKEEATAWATLGQLEQYRVKASRLDVPIAGVGLDSYEKPYPPELFRDLYYRAIEQGFLATAHAGEEGPPQFIWSAIRELGVSRIDHGVRCMEDPALVEFLKNAPDESALTVAYGGTKRFPLTVCPRSNYALKVFPDPTKSNLLQMLDAGLLVSIHSDDPAYFGGYANDNYRAVVDWLDPTVAQLQALAMGGVESSWIFPQQKQPLLDEVRRYFADNTP